MSISVHPVDGLINRLLQQHSSSVGRRENVQRGQLGSGDRVNISRQATDVAADQSVSKLESQLLQLYSPKRS